ncbi:MAG: hypothetical protein R6W78_10675, partial [Bacteroidales bacterium]
MLNSIVSGQAVGDYQSNATGNWNSLGTWQQCIVAGNWAAATAYPGQNTGTGTVTIRNNHVITLNVSPANSLGALTFATGTANATSLTITGQTLNITNAVTFGTPAADAGDQTLIVGTGVLSCASLTMPATGNDNRDVLLTISTGTLNVSGNILMNSSNQRNNITFSSNGTINAGGNFTGGGFTCSTGTVNYNGSGAQNVGSYTYYNLTISNGGYKSLQGSSIVTRVLNLSSGVLQLGDFNLSLTYNAANTIQGTPGSSSMVETNGAGNLIRNAVAALPIVFPIGSGGYYSPVNISAISGTTGTISIKAVTTGAMASNYITRYWDIIASTGPKTITATFMYNPAEAIFPPSIILVKPGAGNWQIPTGTAGFGADNFTVSGTTNIGTTNSSWTASALGTFYSYQTGEWNTPGTWTTDPGGTTQVGNAIPEDNDVIVILNGRWYRQRRCRGASAGQRMIYGILLVVQVVVAVALI